MEYEAFVAVKFVFIEQTLATPASSKPKRIVCKYKDKSPAGGNAPEIINFMWFHLFRICTSGSRGHSMFHANITKPFPGVEAGVGLDL